MAEIDIENRRESILMESFGISGLSGFRFKKQNQQRVKKEIC